MEIQWHRLTEVEPDMENPWALVWVKKEDQLDADRKVGTVNRLAELSNKKDWLWATIDESDLVSAGIPIPEIPPCPFCGAKGDYEYENLLTLTNPYLFWNCDCLEGCCSPSTPNSDFKDMASLFMEIGELVKTKYPHLYKPKA